MARRATITNAAADGASMADAASSAPTFTLVFQEPDGNERTLEGVESGEILRDVMLDADPAVDLYTTWGKVVSCGGGGQCGTCIIEVKSKCILHPVGTAWYYVMLVMLRQTAVSSPNLVEGAGGREAAR